MSNLSNWGGMDSYTWTGSKETVKYYRQIARAMEAIHAKIPKQQFHLNTVATETDIREENFQGTNYQRAVMYLMSNGCEWALKNGNGCTMCGHLAKQTRSDTAISADNYIAQFENEFKWIPFDQFPLLNVYNNGSIINDREIPSEALWRILQMIGETPEIKMLVLETRPEFVTEEKIREIKRLLPDKHIEIAMGLELVDDFLRYVCINKGFTLKQYNKAAEIITREMHMRTYVLLKPPFLTEMEAIEQAVLAVEHSFRVGGTTVSLETCTIQDYTLVQVLSERNGYKTAWLWSILEVVKRTAHLGKLIVGLFQFYPSPVGLPYNCPECSDRVLAALKEYNRTLDVSALHGLDCSCRQQWEAELREEPPTFESRLAVLEDEWTAAE
ncbi:archaeosine biosynthesis radical SAM protein RaSEA [Paenibacillus tepidiphilus]|uniref:archaeosine biosynthesis radical SAM protein RaSEA n=1 Tax=Paenibacillus tepidiphilus TaxID=2608683 RepID=UPI0013A5B0EF|nr:archaeosine biosynthesis radical SAM protein RaSEA [Paenibacillus tepidiphilus]